jgi:hypothetical protein
MQKTFILSQAVVIGVNDLTFTALEHTSDLHNQPITGGRFLTWRNTAELLQAVSFRDGEILTSILS